MSVVWDDKGALLTMKVVDDQAWKKVKERVYKGFSVGVKPLVMRGKDVTTCEWWDTSLVDIGKDKDATISVWRGSEIDPDAEIEVEQEDEILRLDEIGGDFDDTILRAKWTTEKRKSTPLKNFGWPKERKYPIEDQDDVDSAAKLIGKAPEAMRETIKKRIIGIAKRMSLKVPDAWASSAMPAQRSTFDFAILRGKFASAAENGVPVRMRYMAMDMLDSALYQIQDGEYDSDEDRETDMRMACDEFADFVAPIICKNMWPDPTMYADVDTDADMDRSASPTLTRMANSTKAERTAIERAEASEAIAIERLETISTLTRERDNANSELTRVQELERAATAEVTRLSNLPSRTPPARSYKGLERTWGPTLPDDDAKQIETLDKERQSIISRRNEMTPDERKAAAMRLIQIDSEVQRLAG
jgi:hypothetical protein